MSRKSAPRPVNPQIRDKAVEVLANGAPGDSAALVDLPLVQISIGIVGRFRPEYADRVVEELIIISLL
jgi:hypothetical protein